MQDIETLDRAQIPAPESLQELLQKVDALIAERDRKDVVLSDFKLRKLAVACHLLGIFPHCGQAVDIIHGAIGHRLMQKINERM